MTILMYLKKILFSYLSDNYLKNPKTDADLYVFLTDASEDFPGAGVAWLGVLCGYNPQARLSLSAYLHNDVFTVEVT